MKTAFPYWRHRIAPVFDTARQILVVTSDAGMTTGKTRVTLADGHPTARASFQYVAPEDLKAQNEPEDRPRNARHGRHSACQAAARRRKI